MSSNASTFLSSIIMFFESLRCMLDRGVLLHEDITKNGTLRFLLSSQATVPAREPSKRAGFGASRVECQSLRTGGKNVSLAQKCPAYQRTTHSRIQRPAAA